MLAVVCLFLYIFLGVLISRIGVKILQYNTGYECQPVDIDFVIGILWPFAIIFFIIYTFIKICNHFISIVTNNKI